MKSFWLATAAGLATACMASAGAWAAPVSAYGALPVVDHVALSPDGSKIAYVTPDNKGQQGVVVASLSPPGVITSMVGTSQKVRGLAWADGEHVLVMKSQAGFAAGVEGGKDEWSMVQSLDIAKRRSTPLLNADEGLRTRQFTGKEPYIMNVIAGAPQARVVDGKPMVFVRGVAFVDGRGASTLFAVDLEHGRQTRVETALTADDHRSWMIDAQGGLLAQVSYNQVTKLWALRLRRGNGWVDAYTTRADLDTPDVVGLSADGASMIIKTPSSEGYEYKLLSLSGGAPTAAPESFEAFSDLIEDPATHRMIGGVRRGMDTSYVFFDKADQAAWDGIGALFPGEEVEHVSWSNDRRKVLVRVTGQVHGVTYVLVDLASHKASIVADAYQGLKPEDVAGVETITYKASDGLPIPAYLTLPNGRDPKKLPLIVLPHGGPSANDEPGFDYWAQALASRGYAVLQPQFRGSTGFGWDMMAAGFGEWGRKMQTDLSDGVAALGRAGIIDPKRVCIVGGSYGGYAALAGVTLQSGIYRCAVSVAGVSDLHKLLGGSLADPSRDIGLRHIDRYLGAKDPTDPVLDQISPIKFAGKLSAPLLMIHGEDDTVVPIEQSRRMAEALKSAGKPFEFVTLKSEDHWMSRGETRQQMLEATVKFLEANNPPG